MSTHTDTTTKTTIKQTFSSTACIGLFFDEWVIGNDKGLCIN